MILPKYHFILLKYHLILPKYYFFPTWLFQNFHVRIETSPCRDARLVSSGRASIVSKRDVAPTGTYG